jgi:putative peptide zinc metalloprotease protein
MPPGITRTPAVADGSRIRLRRLAERQDGDHWVVGRVETGDFIAVPDVAHRILALLGQGHTVDEAAARLRSETGQGFAVRSFVVALDELGFIAAIDGEPRADADALPPSLPWLRPEHVRWMLHPAMAVAVAGCAVTVVALLATHLSLVPGYRALAWNRHAGLVLAVNIAIGWTLILCHELAHLATARAAGAPARITLSTRLQFLTAQTDVSAVWAAARRTRMTVYLAGVALDTCVIAACLVTLVTAAPGGLTRQLLEVTVAESLLALSTQCMVFMRTDLYYVLQDVSGCANLYAAGSAYLRHLARRVSGRSSGSSADPSLDYPPRQRRAVRLYSAVLLAGTAICLGVEFTLSLPALVTLVARAAAEIATTVPGTLDGTVLVVILLAWQALWCTGWWHRHGGQARSLARNLRKGGNPDGNSGATAGGRTGHPGGRDAAHQHPHARPPRDNAS